MSCLFAYFCYCIWQTDCLCNPVLCWCLFTSLLSWRNFYCFGVTTGWAGFQMVCLEGTHEDFTVSCCCQSTGIITLNGFRDHLQHVLCLLAYFSVTTVKSFEVHFELSDSTKLDGCDSDRKKLMNWANDRQCHVGMFIGSITYACNSDTSKTCWFDQWKSWMHDELMISVLPLIRQMLAVQNVWTTVDSRATLSLCCVTLLVLTSMLEIVSSSSSVRSVVWCHLLRSHHSITLPQPFCNVSFQNAIGFHWGNALVILFLLLLILLLLLLLLLRYYHQQHEVDWTQHMLSR